MCPRDYKVLFFAFELEFETKKCFIFRHYNFCEITKTFYCQICILNFESLVIIHKFANSRRLNMFDITTE